MLIALLVGCMTAVAFGPSTFSAPSQSARVTAVVIDSTTLVRNRSVAVTGVRTLLARLEDPGRVACFDLQPTGVELISSCSDDAYVQTLFSREQRQYSGVSVTLGEAAEIERRNEAVRDGVINRECTDRARSGQCGGAVHAAALALIEDTQRDTEAKLEGVRRLIADGTKRVVVLITAGIPFRHEPRVLDQLIAELSTNRVQLIVVRLDAPSEFGGLVSDAAERLSSQLDDARRMTLGESQEMIQLAELISSPRTGTPSGRRTTAPATGHDAPVVLASLRAYVTRFAGEMKFVIAHERYEQQVRSRAGSFGATAGVVVGSRSTDAEVAFAHIIQGLWIMTRQVATVDGRPVDTPPSPTLADVRTEPEALERLIQLANDAGRWNIGKVRRNINTPTLVMWFLTDPIMARFRFSVAGTEATAAGLCRVVRFTEVTRPALMEVEHEPTPATGRVWVLGGSGAVVKTQLVLERTAPSFRGASPVSRATITVDYGFWPDAKLWVPAKMVERYEQPATRDSEIIVTTAAYSRYQRFSIGVKIK